MQRSKKIASVLLSVTMLSGACAVAGLQLMHQAQVQVLQSGRSMHITAVGAMFTAELLRVP